MEKQERKSEKLFYVVALFVPLIPLFCGYILEGQELPLWLLRSGNKGLLMYQCGVFAIQLLVFGSNYLFYGRMFAGKGKRLARALGIFLYMTSPCHIYICYDKGDWVFAICEALLPLAVWGWLGIRQKRNFAVNGFGLAIGLGGMIWLNADMAFLQWKINSYSIADLLSFWHYRAGHPGVGMGIFIAIIAALWLWIIERKRDDVQGMRGVVFAAAILIVLVIVTGQVRVAAYAVWMLCIPGAWAGSVMGDNSKNSAPKGILLLIVMAALGTCLYQCNWLTYSRAPLDLSGM